VVAAVVADQAMQQAVQVDQAVVVLVDIQVATVADKMEHQDKLALEEVVVEVRDIHKAIAIPDLRPQKVDLAAPAAPELL
jgi:hypothetical protein